MKKRFLTVLFCGMVIFLAVSVGCAKNNTENNGSDSSSENETIVSDNTTGPDSQVSTEAQTETEPQTKTVTITMTGDCSLGRLSIHGYEGTFYEMYDL